MNDNDDPNQGWNAPPNPDASGLDAADAAEAGFITVSDLLGTTSRTIGARFASFLGIALVVLSPAAILGIGSQELMHAGISAQQHSLGGVDDLLVVVAGLGSVGAALLRIVLQFFAQAAIMYVTVEHIAGRRASVGQSLSAGFTHALPILGLAILNSLAIGFGTLVCLIPGFILMCVLFASVPAAVVERLGPIEAMQRSADLTHGHRLTIFLALFVVGLVYLAIVVPLSLALVAGGAVTAPSAGIRVANYALDWGGTTVFTCFQAVLAAVFYARVRGVRDGVDADEIARVFA